MQTDASSAAAAPATPLTGFDAILTLHIGDDNLQERRCRLVRCGPDLLDGLDRLREAVLGGRVARQKLRTIAERLSGRAAIAGDPRVNDPVAQIELRMAVEFAKLAAVHGG